jgi:Flp pilus assembly protein TadG
VSRARWRLVEASQGAVAVEFALLAPLVFALSFGVIQVGFAMQAYNALRGVAADVSRHVAVEDQNSNSLTPEQIRLYATATAVQPPYLLNGERVTVTVESSSSRRVAGVRELSVSVTYAVPNVLGALNLPDLTIRYAQPIFVKA